MLDALMIGLINNGLILMGLEFSQQVIISGILLLVVALVAPDVKAYTHLPGGHAEAWPDALKNVMAEMYAAVLAGRTGPTPTNAFATFHDGHRSALLVDAILESAQRGAWVNVRGE